MTTIDVARVLWLERFKSASGIELPASTLPFPERAAELLRQYQLVLDSHQELHRSLTESAAKLGEPVAIPLPPAPFEITNGQALALEELHKWLLNTEPYFVLRGYAGTGKEQPIRCLVETPHGPKKLGKLKIGDKIYGSAGTLTTVTGIYPQGIKDCYKVTFRDNTSTYCGLEHLWHVQTKKQDSKPQVLTLAELIKCGLTNSAGFKYRVPICAPINYEKRKLPIPPYVMGVLLGDGSFRNPLRSTITCASFDLDIIKKVKSLLPKFTLSGRYISTNCKQYVICDPNTYGNRFAKTIKSLGLSELYSDEKFIPKDYLLSSVEDRWELLRGLMDTDGTSRGNRISFSTTSKLLVRDIKRLIQSLGGLAIVQNYIGHSVRQDGSTARHYTVNVKTFENPFWLKRKAKNWKLSYNNSPVRSISNIEYIGREEQMCIRVSARDHLYLTDNFIVTHNTHVVSMFANKLSQHTSIFTAPTNKATKVLRKLMPSHVCRTIYSVLSLKMVEREDELVLESSDEKFNLSGYHVIVVDEASMLNSELLEYIDEASRAYGIKFLFVCDDAQLPPVGEDISPVLDLDCQNIQLTQVVRHDNQILEIATHVRRSITRHKKLPPIDLATSATRCVWQLSGRGFIERLQQAAHKTKFVDVKAIAWRNATVDRLNAVIRQQLYSAEDLARSTWLVGDQVVVTEPITESRKILATTDDEGIITTSEIGHDAETGLKCYFLSIRMESGVTVTIRTVHEDSMRELQRQLSIRASDARKPNQGKLWGKFWELKNRFNNIRHSYAITAHRSQGSTFKYVFVDAGDILANPDRPTAYRCLYVALTRPSDRLYITGFPI